MTQVNPRGKKKQSSAPHFIPFFVREPIINMRFNSKEDRHRKGIKAPSDGLGHGSQQYRDMVPGHCCLLFFYFILTNKDINLFVKGNSLKGSIEISKQPFSNLTFTKLNLSHYIFSICLGSHFKK